MQRPGDDVGDMSRSSVSYGSHGSHGSHGSPRAADWTLSAQNRLPDIAIPTVGHELAMFVQGCVPKLLYSFFRRFHKRHVRPFVALVDEVP